MATLTKTPKFTGVPWREFIMVNPNSLIDEKTQQGIGLVVLKSDQVPDDEMWQIKDCVVVDRAKIDRGMLP